MYRVELFAIASLLCIGCPANEDKDRPKEQADPSDAADAAAAAKPSKAEPKAEAEAETKPSKAEPKAPTPPTPSADSTPDGETETPLPAPTKAEVLKVLSPVVPGKLAVLAPPARLDSTAYAVAWRRIDPSKPAAADVVLATVRGTPSDAGTTWALGGHHIVHRIETPWIEEPDMAIPTTLRVEDFDDDDEPEILIRMRGAIMCGGGGENTVTTLVVLDTDPLFAEALRTELGHTILANPTETKAVVRHEDLDGDGHRDVGIRYTTVSPQFGTSREENQWIWDKATDTWALKTENYSDWGCEW